MDRKSCKGCVHFQPLSISMPYHKTCFYILDTGKMRGCPADNCDKYVRGSIKRGRKALRIKPWENEPISIDDMADYILKL